MAELPWKKDFSHFLFLFFIVSVLFFNKMFFTGLVPFPGDLIVGQYAPYNSYSFMGYLPNAYPNNGQDFDVAKLIYPAKYFSVESFKNSQIPLWNPHIFSGNPHLASLQSGSFYPLNFIFAFLPFIFTWSIFIYIQPLLAGIFTYLFLKQLRLGFKSSFLGSLVFAYSSYFVVWIQYGNIGHSILWLPLLLYLSLKYIKKPSWILSVSLVLGLASSLLAGYIQTSFYVFAFVLAFMLFNIFMLEKQKRLRVFLGIIPIFVLPVLLSAVQLIPTFELLRNSTRTPFEASNFFKLLIPKVHAATLFVPDFFGNPATRNYWLNGTYIERVTFIGVLPVVLGLLAILKRESKIIWFFILSSGIALILSFDTIISRLIYSVNIPFISTAVPTRMMFIFCFSASVLAAFGFDYLEKIKEKKHLFISLFSVGSVFIFLWIFVLLAPKFFQNEAWISNLSVSKRNLILPTGIFSLGAIIILITVYKSRFKKYLLIALILLTVFDLYYFFQKITPFSPKQSAYPVTEVFNRLKSVQGIDRSWGYGSGYIEPNFQTIEKLYSTDGYDALHLKRYSELISTSGNGKIPQSLPRSEAEIVRGYGNEDLRVNKYRQTILNLLGVKYLIHKVDLINTAPDFQTFDEAVYKLVSNEYNWQIFENKEAVKRISLYGNYVVENNSEKIIDKIHDPEFNLKDTLILEEKLPEDILISKDENSRVKIEKYEPNEIIITTSSVSDSILFLSDSYSDGWKVKVDGNEQRIYRADYAFRAVPIRKGEHSVAFSYKPASFDLGLKISVATFLVLILLTILTMFKKRK